MVLSSCILVENNAHPDVRFLRGFPTTLFRVGAAKSESDFNQFAPFTSP